MKKIKQKLKFFSTVAIGCIGFVIISLFLIAGINIARAAWDEPQAGAPEGNIFAPLNTGPDKQAKKGYLLLDPFYNPDEPMPQISYPLEVRGTKGAYINDLLVDVDGSLIVDTDTLYVDGASHFVGIGTDSPQEKLDIAGGALNIGKPGAGVAGTGLAASSTAEYGIYGLSQNDAPASVYGSSVSAPGIYGLNTSTGAGILAESLAESAVVGDISAPYDSAGVVKSGIYGRARGLDAWAGYFANRVYGAQEIVGRKFVPNSLQFSQVPYTAGWEIRSLPHTQYARPYLIAFDGDKIWTVGMGEIVYVQDAKTGFLLHYFRPRDSSGEYNFFIKKIIYAGGYIWLGASKDGAGCSDGRETVTRIDPDTYDVDHYLVGPCHAGSDSSVRDLVYDDQTAGGPYIWTASKFGDDYAIGRLDLNDFSYMDPVKASGLCDTYAPEQCSDSLDNDGDGDTDGDDSQCITPSPKDNAFGSSANDERLALREVGSPTGIVLQPGSSNLWISFSGSSSAGEGIAKVDATDPSNSTVYCIGPGRAPGDIIYDEDNDLVWVGNDPGGTWEFYLNGITAINPLTGMVEYDYHYVNDKVSWGHPADEIRYDNQSAGGPYIWSATGSSLDKYYNITDPVTLGVDYFSMPTSSYDLILDYLTAGNPYVWLPSEHGSTIVKFDIDNDELYPYIPQGAPVGDMIFDGSAVWVSNPGSFAISKYQASDGVKIGDYRTGFKPGRMIFDGSSIWTINYAASRTLSQIRASDGVKIGDYNRLNGESADDAVFDGRNLWWSRGGNNWLRRIDLDTCDDPNGGDSIPGSCATIDQFDALTVNGEDLKASRMVFDGEAIWATRSDSIGNKIAKINLNGSVEAGLTITGVNLNSNITSIAFDGTFLWIGKYHADSEGNSVYKIDPRGQDNTDSNSGICSDDPTVNCNTDADCGAGICEALVVAKFPIYHESGRCGAASGSVTGSFCESDLDCVAGEECWGKSDSPHVWVGVASLAFDGTYMWVTSGVSTDNLLEYECGDGVDNDGDGVKDGFDTDCLDQGYDYFYNDRHEADSMALFGTDTPDECRDGVDNDGNGLCDYDGAPGQPGCSGRPDMGCSAADDTSESMPQKAGFLTRIAAADNQIIDSVRITKSYCSPSYSVYDGTHLWLGARGGCYAGNQVLAQYYTGGGFGLTDLSGSVGLAQGIDINNIEPGGFSLAGSINFGQKLTVVGDIAVLNNTWAGAADNDKNFGAGCADGEFAKGVNITAGSEILQCRGL